MKIKELKNKDLVILGIGREGLDSFLFLRKIFPHKIISIADQKEVSELDPETEKILSRDDQIKYYGGKDYLKCLKNFDITIKSPGIQFDKIKKSLKNGSAVTSQTQLFFENCPAKIIGVTGTKGKSTTSALIYNLLKKSKKPAYLLGNIEKPSLSYLLKIKKKDWVVYELSSHQLQFLKSSPHIAIFLNIYPEHLDYYKDFKDYFNAKTTIAKFQTSRDYFIFNSSFKEISGLAKKIKSKKIKIEPQKYAEMFKQHPEFKKITHGENIAAVIEVGKILKLTNKQILKGMKTFKPLSHRLELIGKFGGIEFYDDSIATIPEATIFALHTLGKNVETIILGGFDRGIDFKKISDEVSANHNLKNLIFLPTSGEKIWAGIDSKNKARFNKYFVNDMESAVKICFEKTTPGKICLLSCASPSFGLFKCYKERGNLFKEYVMQYAK